MVSTRGSIFQIFLVSQKYSPKEIFDRIPFAFYMTKNSSKEIITLTEAAKERIKIVMSKAKGSCVGLRIGIDNKGCSGHAYKIEYAKTKLSDDEEVLIGNIKIFVEATAIMYILGSKMDYVNNGVESGFVFNNPNEKGRCGCGESFHI